MVLCSIICDIINWRRIIVFKYFWEIKQCQAINKQDTTVNSSSNGRHTQQLDWCFAKLKPNWEPFKGVRAVSGCGAWLHLHLISSPVIQSVLSMLFVCGCSWEMDFMIRCVSVEVSAMLRVRMCSWEMKFEAGTCKYDRKRPLSSPGRSLLEDLHGRPLGCGAGW